MKKMRTKILAAILLALLGATALAGIVMAGGMADQRSALAGTVLADQLAVVGQTVHEGDVLVKVQTISGAVPAARASANGTVRQVLVSPGGHIAAGQVVVKLEVQ